MAPSAFGDDGVDEELSSAIECWDQEYQATYDPADPAGSGFEREERTESWLARGLELTRALSPQLPIGVTVLLRRLGRDTRFTSPSAEEHLPTPTETHTYLARFAAGRARDRPSGVMRRRLDGDRVVTESFTRNLRWESTDYLDRNRIGRTDGDHVEISADEAAALVRRLTAGPR